VFGDPGPGDQLAVCLGGLDIATQARARLASGAVFRADVRVDTPTGEHWFDTVVRRSLDPVTGQPAVLVTQRDVTERRAELRELEHSRELLAGQAQALRVLAAPVIEIGPGVLAMPLIGRLDHARVEVALAALVGAAGERASHVVLDLTGADAADLAGTGGLVRVVRVLRLRGIRVALSGIRPALARALVDADLDLTGLACFATVADALASVDRR
ncbi:MAG TPA: STAS domain-containing protein, partial [Nannocystis sp.]|jgi:anti-anti-sigma regulatory factor